MKRALDSVNEKILAAIKRRRADIVAADSLPRLIAVSKLKPIASIIEAYECGQRYFGENYIQELETKSNSKELLDKCPDIKFHFIGHLQSNKANKLLKVKNLHMIETIDSAKLADLINKSIDKHRREGGADTLYFGDNHGKLESHQLRVLIQVNTSGEEQKNGVQPNEVVQLADHITKQCRWLHLAGLMTIGKLEGWNEPGPNKDFLKLYEVRDALSKHLSIDPRELELSMGMSSDFEEAIELGSTNVRVGTMIFGERPPKNSG
jgi:pyridoxal phosphate enzyme (YggS family)